jgi:RNA polymerase sigma-70 factor (ECF subfamily)
MSADQAVLLNVHIVERAITPDDDIVQAAQSGSPEAFRKLHAIYSRRLHQTIMAITKNPQDAEDALQDTFLRAYVAIGTFEGRCKIYTWLTRIAVNSALMILRKRRLRPEMLVDPQLDYGAEIVLFEVKDSAPNPEQVYELHQRQLTLLRAIRGLPPSASTNSDANDAWMVNEGDRPGAQPFRSSRQGPPAQSASAAFRST